MLCLLIPPTIFLLEFKTKQELLSMPVTFEEHEQELADEEVEEEEEEDAEAENVQENRSFDGSCRAMTGQNGAMELRFISELLLRGTPCSIDVCLSKSRV